MLRIDGGLGRNDSVLQAIADLAGVRLERTAAAEVTARGAAALAGIGTGRWEEAVLEGLPVSTDHTVEPELSAADREAARTLWQERLAGVISRASAGKPP